MKEKMLKRLCKLISWYNHGQGDEYYHYYMGYLLALHDMGVEVEIFQNDILYVDGKSYRIEDYANA